MSKQFDEVYSHFAQNHIKLKRQWLDDLLKYLIAYRNNADDLINLVFHQWLYTDLGQSTETEAANAATANINNQQQIQTAHIFQIRSVSDIGTPRYKQFKKMTDPGYDESTAELGINDFADGGNNFNLNKGAKCYCLQVTDCQGQQFKAFEKKRVPQLSLATCPGSKILVFGGTKIVQGVFFLSPENCQFLGGAVEHLLHDQNILKQLSEQFGKPIPSAKQPAPTIGAVNVQQQQPPPKVQKCINVDPEVLNAYKPLPMNSMTMAKQPATIVGPNVNVQQQFQSKKPLVLPVNLPPKQPAPRIWAPNVQQQQYSLPQKCINVDPPKVLDAYKSLPGNSPPKQPAPTFGAVNVQQLPKMQKHSNVDPKVLNAYKSLRVNSLAEVYNKMNFSIGCKRFTVIAWVKEITVPFRIADDKWAMSVALMDESQRQLECQLEHELLLGLVMMSPKEAQDVKLNGSAEKKKEGNERIQLMEEQLMRLDLVFEVEVMFRGKSPTIKDVQTLADRLGII